MSSPPLDPAGCERIGVDHFVAAAPALRSHGHDALASELESAARHLCDALVLHRRSPAYRVRLRPPVVLGVERLAAALLRAADVLDGGSNPLAALASWCSVLAARLQAVAHEPDVRVTRMLVFVTTNAQGQGELLFSPVSDDDLERCPGLRPSLPR